MQKPKPMTANIDAFWQRTLERSAKQPLDATVEKVNDRLPHEKYRVTYHSLAGIPVRAYLGLPIEGERPAHRWPAIVTAPGYGGWEFGMTLHECLRGYVLLQVYPRSQGESGELWKVEPGAYQAWMNHGKHDPEGFYYQGAFVDMIRGIDYLLTRDDVDPDRIGLMGTSQGGGIVLSVGALDPRVNAVVAHVPYFCDLRHNEGFKSCDLGNDPKFLRTFDYFDPVNLAPRLKAPVLLSTGGKDKTCPEETIRAVFDKLPGIKALAHYPELTHTSSGDFYGMTWEWMERYLKRS